MAGPDAGGHVIPGVSRGFCPGAGPGAAGHQRSADLYGGDADIVVRVVFFFGLDGRTLVEQAKTRETGAPEAYLNTGARILLSSALGAGDQKISDNQGIHLSAFEAVDRFLWLADDRFVVVERSIENHRHAGLPFKFADQFPVAWIGRRCDGLQPASAVYVRGRRNF